MQILCEFSSVGPGVLLSCRHVRTCQLEHRIQFQSSSGRGGLLFRPRAAKLPCDSYNNAAAALMNFNGGHLHLNFTVIALVTKTFD